MSKAKRQNLPAQLQRASRKTRKAFAEAVPLEAALFRRDGRLIGQWKRALIFLSVCLGQFGSIDSLVAGKSIFRLSELKDRDNRKEAEYITIGTLMGLGWAISVAYLRMWLARIV